MDPADFEAVFESSPNSYMLLDRQLRFVAANAAYVRAAGIPFGAEAAEASIAALADATVRLVAGESAAR